MQGKLNYHLIDEKRKERGWTYADLGHAIDVSRAQAHEICRGTSGTKLQRILRITELFGLTLEEIITGGTCLNVKN